MDYKNILFIAATVAVAVAAYAVVEMRSAEVDESNQQVTEAVKANPVTIAQDQAVNGEDSMEKMEKDGEEKMMDKMEDDATSTDEVMEKEEGEDSMEKMEKDGEEVMEKDEQ